MFNCDFKIIDVTLVCTLTKKNATSVSLFEGLSVTVEVNQSQNLSAVNTFQNSKIKG